MQLFQGLCSNRGFDNVCLPRFPEQQRSVGTTVSKIRKVRSILGRGLLNSVQIYSKNHDTNHRRLNALIKFTPSWWQLRQVSEHHVPYGVFRTILTERGSPSHELRRASLAAPRRMTHPNNGPDMPLHWNFCSRLNDLPISLLLLPRKAPQELFWRLQPWECSNKPTVTASHAHGEERLSAAPRMRRISPRKTAAPSSSKARPPAMASAVRAITMMLLFHIHASPFKL